MSTKYILNHVGEILKNPKFIETAEPIRQEPAPKPEPIAVPAYSYPPLPWSHEVLAKTKSVSHNVSPLLDEWLAKRPK